MSLTPDLARLKDEIQGHARAAGLDPFETVFELVDVEELNEVAAYGGFPTRFPHWRHGMEFEHLRKTHVYGLSRIYELVINNDPAYAYLMRSNSLVMQKLVIAHVYAHVDFFRHNLWFSKTNRKMMDEMANHATRVRRYVERYGLERVENFLDVALSLENLIDPFAPFAPHRDEAPANGAVEAAPEPVRRLPSKGYMERFVNPPSFLEAQRAKAAKAVETRKRRFPAEPAKDVLGFLLEHAPLERWQRDVLDIVRQEAYYFAPQAQTKTLNEGWASFWHSNLLTSKVLDSTEVVDYADHHSATMSSAGGLNPYKLGMELFRDIEERWNKGRFGPEWERCDDLDEKRTWDLGLGLGREKIFEVRKIYNDVGFIDTFLTEEFCHRHKLFVYKWNARTGRYEITDREFAKVKEQLLVGLTNLGHPFISVEDANHANRGELLMAHRHDGVDLRLDHARDTLRNLQSVWQRPVHLRTMVEAKAKILSYDGEHHRDQDAGE